MILGSPLTMKTVVPQGLMQLGLFVNHYFYISIFVNTNRKLDKYCFVEQYLLAKN